MTVHSIARCLAPVLLLLSATASAASRTERSTVLILGNNAGYQEAVYGDDGAVRVHFEYNDRGRGPKLDATYRLAPDQTLDASEVKGVAYFKTPVEERFTRDAAHTGWKNGSEDVSRDERLPGQYLDLDSVPEEFVLLMRALLAAPEHRLPLLPVGEARIAEVARMPVKAKDGTPATAVLYAIDGMDLTPSYAWLDDQGRFLASYSDWQSLAREGFEGTLPALGEKQKAVEAEGIKARAHALTHRIEGTLAIDDVRVFDPDALAVRGGQRVVVRDGKVAAVGDMASTPAPDGAQHVDGHGQFLMAGLWDMHVHVGGATDGLLYIAAGITTVRDLANDRDSLLAKVKGYESADDIGPRVIRAGFVDGRSPYSGPTKVFADNEDEARAAVAQFAKDGFEQVKVYSSIDPKLVPLFAKLAHENGMRISGHVPNGMSARQFVEAGVDEIQHANFLFLNFLADDKVDTRTPQRFSLVADRAVDVPLDGPEMRAFIDLLVAHKTVIDPTLVTFENMFLERPKLMGPTYYPVVQRLPVTWQRGLRAATGGLAVTPENDVTHRESYQRMIDLVGLMYRSGVTVVAGTDAGPLFALARELELYTHAGIPPAEVLRLATHGAARVMKRGDAYGKVAPGYVADLILIDGDPTKLITDVRKVRTVVKGDRWYEPAKLYEAVGIAP